MYFSSMIKRYPALTFENVFFWLCLLASLWVVWFNPYNPTLDGPAHLYNAQLMNYLIGGNKFIGSYYTLNKIPVANLTDHYILACMLDIFSWQMVEKLFPMLYLLGFSLLFRRLIRQWNPTHTGLSMAAIPFSFSLFYYWGFFNFCLSFLLLFAIVIYYHKHFFGENKTASPVNYLILGLLATLQYFTNGLAFLFTGLLVFLMELPQWIRFFSNAGFKALLNRVGLIALAWLPGITCFLAFLHKIRLPSGGDTTPFSDLMHDVYTMRPLLVFGKAEITYTHYFFYLLVIAFIAAIYFRLRKRSAFKWNAADIILLLALIAFLLYLFIPDDADVGMMSVRLEYFFAVFLLLWIALQKGSRIITGIISIAFLVVHFSLMFTIHQQVLSDLIGQEAIIRDASKIIKPNSVVLAVDVTDNWLAHHFPDYLGVDKPVVILDNYEANDGWFATAWNTSSQPQMLLNGKSLVPPFDSLPSVPPGAINYIFVYGNYNNIAQKTEWSTVNEVLKKDYALIYTSKDKYVHIFSPVGQ